MDAGQIHCCCATVGTPILLTFLTLQAGEKSLQILFAWKWLFCLCSSRIFSLDVCFCVPTFFKQHKDVFPSLSGLSWFCWEGWGDLNSAQVYESPPAPPWRLHLKFSLHHWRSIIWVWCAFVWVCVVCLRFFFFSFFLFLLLGIYWTSWIILFIKFWKISRIIVSIFFCSLSSLKVCFKSFDFFPHVTKAPFIFA